MSKLPLRKVSGIFFSVFASINEAAFSFVGMLTLLQGHGFSNNLKYGLGVGSGFAALSIESEVFYQNICSGLNYATTHKGLKLKIIRDMIINKYNEDLNTENEFLQLYIQLYIALLERIPKQGHDNKIKKEIFDIQYNLYCMDKALMEYFENDSLLQQDVKDDFNTLFSSNHKNLYLYTYHHKNTLRTAANIFTYCSLPGCFFASAFMAKSLLIAASASGSLLLGGTIIIAAFAGIAYFYQIYNTFAEMIYNDLLQEHYHQLKSTWLHLNCNGVHTAWTLSQKILTRSSIILTTALFLGLIVLLTLATAGTWIKCGVNGQLFLFQCCLGLVNTIVKISALLYTLISVIFNIKNIMHTISSLFDADYSELFQDTKKVIAIEIKGSYQDFIDTKHCLTSYPLIFLAIILRVITSAASTVWFAAILLTHCISEGVTIDKGSLISAGVAATANGTAELLTDIPYVTKGDTNITPKFKQKINPNMLPSHNHSAGILDKLFFIFFSPLLITNSFFCWIFTKATYKEAFNKHIKPFWSGHQDRTHDREDKILQTIPTLPDRWVDQIYAFEKNEIVNHPFTPVLEGC